MPNTKPGSSRGKVLFFGGAAALAMALFALYPTDTRPNMSAKRISTAGTNPLAPNRPAGISPSRAADSPSALSPYGERPCPSADCSPVVSAQLSPITQDELPPRALISLYVDQIINGDVNALSAVREGLDRCLKNHRNRLVSNKAFAIESPAEVDECGASELAELVATIDVAVQHGFNPDRALNLNSKMARLAWMASVAQLDDASRQLADLPQLQPDANGTIFFADVPPPKRLSPLWKNAATFAKEHGPSDPAIQSMGEALATLGEGSSPGAGSSQQTIDSRQ